MEFIYKNLKRIGVIILIIIAIILLFSYCGSGIKNKIIIGLGGYTSKSTSVKIDTVSVEYDSIYDELIERNLDVMRLEDKLVVIGYKYKQLLSSSSTETIKGKPNPGDILSGSVVEIDSAYVFNNAVSDTLIEGNIRTVVNPANCEIIEQRLSYSAKFPIFVTKTVEVFRTKETTLSNKPTPKYGLGILGNTNSSLGAFLIYQTPTNWQFQGGYIWDNVRVPTRDELNNIDVTKTINNGAFTFQISKLF